MIIADQYLYIVPVINGKIKKWRIPVRYGNRGSPHSTTIFEDGNGRLSARIRDDIGPKGIGKQRYHHLRILMKPKGDLDAVVKGAMKALKIPKYTSHLEELK